MRQNMSELFPNLVSISSPVFLKMPEKDGKRNLESEISILMLVLY